MLRALPCLIGRSDSVVGTWSFLSAQLPRNKKMHVFKKEVCWNFNVMWEQYASIFYWVEDTKKKWGSDFDPLCLFLCIGTLNSEENRNIAKIVTFIVWRTVIASVIAANGLFIYFTNFCILWKFPRVSSTLFKLEGLKHLHH